jgi:drug/metabolite transporter (DMT)-like permease
VTGAADRPEESHVWLALAGVVAAAFCSGAAAVLQARAARLEPHGTGLEASLLVRLLRRPVYLAALGLVVAGFGLSFLALRTLPLFVVQSGRASSLAVTAVLSVVVLRARLSRWETGAVVAVVAGLVLLAGSADTEPADAVPDATRVGLVVGVVLVAVLASAALRVLPGPRAGLVLAVLSGLSFALLALAARVLRSLAPLDLLTDAAAWAMGLAGLLGLLLTAVALQRTPVVAATAAMVATETLVGALLGMLLSGDRPAPGGTDLALGGFALVLAGALSLARFGAPEPVVTPH